MINKTLHYVWIGPDKDEQPFVDEWQSVMPEYTVQKWINPEQYLERAIDLFGGLERLTLKSYTYVSDLVRLLILKDHGGVYLDHDIKILKDFSDLLDNECVLTFQYENDGEPLPSFANGKSLSQLLQSDYGKYQKMSATVNNCFIATQPEHTFINTAIEETLINHFNHQSKQYAMSDWGVGPEIFTKVAKLFGFDTDRCQTQIQNNIKILHKKHLHPTHSLVRYISKEQYLKELVEAENNVDTYAVHYHTNTGAKKFINSDSSFKSWYVSRM